MVHENCVRRPLEKILPTPMTVLVMDSPDEMTLAAGRTFLSMNFNSMGVISRSESTKPIVSSYQVVGVVRRRHYDVTSVVQQVTIASGLNVTLRRLLNDVGAQELLP